MTIGQWDWLVASSDELTARGVPRGAIASLRRRHVGHSKPLSARWLRAVGRWGGVQRLSEIADAVGMDRSAVKNYANAHRLKYATATHHTTHAQLALRLWLDRLSAPRDSAEGCGVLLVERHILCAAMQGLLDDQGVTIRDVLGWRMDELETVWASYRFELSPPEAFVRAAEQAAINIARGSPAAPA